LWLVFIDDRSPPAGHTADFLQIYGPQTRYVARHAASRGLRAVDAYTTVLRRLHSRPGADILWHLVELS